MGSCTICGLDGMTISGAFGLCRNCILDGSDSAEKRAASVHRDSRGRFGLSPSPPDDPHGLPCPLCTNRCRPASGGRGFCDVRRNVDGRWTGGRSCDGRLSWYYDALPTNCVADWVCPAGTASGFPRFTDTEGPEYGYSNLAVFYEACSFNCLFCQNWHFRERGRAQKTVTARELADCVDERTRCICYFGGDPTPQLPHSLRASFAALERKHGDILRICWETNGSMAPGLLRPMARIALESGGCVKFDLKAWDDGIHQALTQVSNRRTLDNFSRIWELMKHRPDPPPLVASTLLVPGYITPDEVAGIARFIASVDLDIPYSLLAFHPQFLMSDLPVTTRSHAEAALAAARDAELSRVRVGNMHLLWPD